MTISNETETASMPPRPRGAALEHSIMIECPAETVWQVLADVDHWGQWNPIYTEATGRLDEGASIALTIALPGMKPQQSTATVYRALPNQALQFGAFAFARTVHATRYVEIVPITSSSCRVLNGEAFGRILGPTLVRLIGAKIEDGLRRQNEGLKAAAEARHRAAS